MDIAIKARTAILAALVLASTWAATEGRAQDICQGLQPASGIGSVTQAPAHTGVFIPAYNSICPTSGITYQGVGDAAGVTAAITHDDRYPFYSTDLPLTAAEKQFAERDTSTVRFRFGSSINHVPMLLDGFAIAYNLGACSTTGPLRLSGTTLSLIYAGAITQWKHELILRDNPSSPQLRNCGLGIRPAVRNDPGGPSTIFKDYLAKRNPAWIPFTAKELNTVWPRSLTITCRGDGDLGMASCIGDPGAIGYVEYRVANTKGLKMAHIDNGAGQFMAPSTDPVGMTWPNNCTEAANSSAVPPSTLSDWSQTSLTNPPRGYALCSFTYVLIYQQMGYAYTNAISAGRSVNVVQYLRNSLSDTVQGQLTGAGYAPLPPAVRSIGRQGLDLITYQ